MLKFPIPNAGILARLTLSITYFIFIALKKFVCYRLCLLVWGSSQTQSAHERNWRAKV